MSAWVLRQASREVGKGAVGAVQLRDGLLEGAPGLGDRRRSRSGWCRGRYALPGGSTAWVTVKLRS